MSWFRRKLAIIVAGAFFVSVIATGALSQGFKSYEELSADARRECQRILESGTDKDLWQFRFKYWFIPTQCSVFALNRDDSAFEGEGGSRTGNNGTGNNGTGNNGTGNNGIGVSATEEVCPASQSTC